MHDCWWVTRPKRKLNSIPEVLSLAAENVLRQQWKGERDTHLRYESDLEDLGLKRIGDRRDQSGSGARTYFAWLRSLGLVFEQSNTGLIQLTLAGEAVLSSDYPAKEIANQVLKYQFPSAYSILPNVAVSPEFKIHPFWFLLKLLSDSRINYLKQDEIEKIVIIEAKNETDECYEKVVTDILNYRSFGISALDNAFFGPNATKGISIRDDGTSNLSDIANTILNWLEYTQLVYRIPGGKVAILTEKKSIVDSIISKPMKFIPRPENEEFYARQYGLDTRHHKDTRNLLNTSTVSNDMIMRQKIQTIFLNFALENPVTEINTDVVDYIAEKVNCPTGLVENVLRVKYPNGAIGAFLTEYRSMAFMNREKATSFELVTAKIFSDIFGFRTKHVGPIGKTPDVLVVSDSDNYQGIIDNKAYSSYSISNDHHNRMVHNYIKDIGRYTTDPLKPLAFYGYIAGGFARNIDSQLQSISNETGIHGAAIGVDNFIEMVMKQTRTPYSHATIRNIFNLDRQVLLRDI